MPRIVSQAGSNIPSQGNAFMVAMSLMSLLKSFKSHWNLTNAELQVALMSCLSTVTVGDAGTAGLSYEEGERRAEDLMIRLIRAVNKTYPEESETVQAATMGSVRRQSAMDFISSLLGLDPTKITARVVTVDKDGKMQEMEGVALSELEKLGFGVEQTTAAAECQDGQCPSCHTEAPAQSQAAFLADPTQPPPAGHPAS